MMAILIVLCIVIANLLFRVFKLECQLGEISREIEWTKID